MQTAFPDKISRTTGRPDRLPADRRGVTLLLTMILIGALILAIGLSVAYLSQTQVIISGHIDYAQSLRQAAFACVDEAFIRLRSDLNFTGDTLELGMDTCTSVVSGSGLNRTVTVDATEGDYALRIVVEATLRQNSSSNARGWEVLRWQETNP